MLWPEKSLDQRKSNRPFPCQFCLYFYLQNYVSIYLIITNMVIICCVEIDLNLIKRKFTSKFFDIRMKVL